MHKLGMGMHDVLCLLMQNVRMLGFIMFWIAVGMVIALLLQEDIFLSVCIIIILIVVGFNMFCKS